MQHPLKIGIKQRSIYSRKSQGGIINCKIYLLLAIAYGVLTDKYEYHCKKQSQRKLPYTYEAPLPVRPKAHIKEQKNIDIGLSCRQGIGIMQSMPDKIQYVYGKAHQHEQ